MKMRRILGCIFVLGLILLIAGRTSSITPTARAASSGCNSSWQGHILSPSVSGQLFGIAAISQSDIWAVGYGYNPGKAVIEHWNGTGWSLISSPQPGNYSNVLFQVSALSSNNVWAAGYYQNAKNGFEEPEKTLVEHWNGASWSIITTPNPGGFDKDLDGIKALSADDIWATGGYGPLAGPFKSLIEHWDGKQWSIVSTPNPGSASNVLGAMSALSSTDIWAVGSYSNNRFGDNQTLVEHWNGKQWSVVPSPNIGNNGDQLGGITAISDQDIWAVGEYEYHYPGGSTLIATLTEHWNGQQWSIIKSPNLPGYDSDLHGVASLASNEIYAVGSSNSGPIAMHWNGQQWQIGHITGAWYRILWDVAALSPNDLWAVGSIGVNLLVMHYC